MRDLREVWGFLTSRPQQYYQQFGVINTTRIEFDPFRVKRTEKQHLANLGLKPEAIEMFDSFRVLNLVLKSYVLKILLAWLKIARSPPKNISLWIFLRFLCILRESGSVC